MSAHLKWSQAFPLFESDHHRPLIGRPGGYRIRAFTSRGTPRKISRMAGTDRDGILHIGKSGNLGKRIRHCRQSAEGIRGGHHAGREYFEWGFDRLAPPKLLRYDYVVTRTEKRALALERRLHEGYRRRYLDRPPLDSTSGQDRW